MPTPSSSSIPGSPSRLLLLWTSVLGIVAAVAGLVGLTVNSQAGVVTVDPLVLSVLWGAMGGLVYELILLKGGIELPHLPDASELPEEGLPHATARYLLDLGILSRLLIGAAAALAIFWVLPTRTGTALIATSLIAGSAGTAVFRSLQDRLVAAIQTAKIDTVNKAMTNFVDSTEALQTTERFKIREPNSEKTLHVRTMELQDQASDLRDQASELRGQIKTLLAITRSV